MKTRIHVFESAPAARHRVSMVLLMAIAAILVLFASGVACHLLDPDRDWPQARTSPASPAPAPHDR